MEILPKIRVYEYSVAHCSRVNAENTKKGDGQTLLLIVLQEAEWKTEYTVIVFVLDGKGTTNFVL